MRINSYEIFYHFYPHDNALRQLLLLHSELVRLKALALMDAAEFPAAVRERLSRSLVEEGALLHDIGVGLCAAESIYCTGSEPYLAHGILGARRLREYAADYSLDLEAHARICERHIGSGMTHEELQAVLPPGYFLPSGDFLPETLEEKLVCFADMFFSKGRDPCKERSLEQIVSGTARFGEAALARLRSIVSAFGITLPGEEKR